MVAERACSPSLTLLSTLPAAFLQVLIWSAVACSSAFPFLYVPQQLLARDSRGQVVPFSAQVGGWELGSYLWEEADGGMGKKKAALFDVQQCCCQQGKTQHVRQVQAAVPTACQPAGRAADGGRDAAAVAGRQP